MTPGQTAYTAFYLTIGEIAPHWDALPLRIRGAWEAAGVAVLAKVGPQVRNAVRTLDGILKSAADPDPDDSFTRTPEKAVEDARAFIEAAFGES